MWDVFISHASEDKESIARPLANELRKQGLKVWFDEFTLKVGDSLRRSIDEGLANSTFGVVILSPSFFKKEWPQSELDGLTTRQARGKKIILPVWHRVNRDDVAGYSPVLADRVAVSTDRGLAVVVQELLQVLASRQGDTKSFTTKLRFLNDIWLEPLSVKVLINSLNAGGGAVVIDWPESTNNLIDAVKEVVEELKGYQESTSPFHKFSADWVASAYQMAHGFSRYAQRILERAPIRVPLLWKGMSGYFGDPPLPTFETSLNNFLALCNASIQLKLSLLVDANFPEKRQIVPPHLSDWLRISWAHPRQVFECLFQTGEPIYAAEIHRVSNVPFNHYIYGPKSKILEAYNDYMFPLQPIINGWFARHLIPQIELIIVEERNDLDFFIEYREEALINKIRDENDQELKFDPSYIKRRFI